MTNQSRPKVVKIKIYIEDNGNYYRTCISPEDKKVSAIFWTLPESVENEILASSDEQLENYIEDANNGCPDCLPPQLKADPNFECQDHPSSDGFKIEDTLLGHFYQSLNEGYTADPKSGIPDPRSSGAAYAATRWCYKVDSDTWTPIDNEELECNHYVLKPLSSDTAKVTGLTPVLFKIPKCKTNSNNFL